MPLEVIVKVPGTDGTRKGFLFSLDPVPQGSYIYGFKQRY